MWKRLIFVLLLFTVVLWTIHRKSSIKDVDVEVQKKGEFVYVPRKRSRYAKMTWLDHMVLAKSEYQRLLEPLPNLDFKEVTRRSRVLADLYSSSKFQSHNSDLLYYLMGQLFPYTSEHFSFNSLANIIKRNERGVVITCGNHYFPFAVHAVRTLRYLGCPFPVEIWYCGEKDLDRKNVNYFKSFSKVKIRNVKDVFPNVAMEKWDIKPFAMLASDFSEVLLMDADSVFVQNPEVLFADPDYQRDGALFFNDRSLFGGGPEKPMWILDLFPEPHSHRVRNLRMVKGLTQYELEAGVVLIDKRRHAIGMLTVCLLNYPGPMKTVIRDETHGEKETFWIGLEMANEPYSFIPSLPGSIGVIEISKKEKLEEVCGKLAHFDRKGNLLWFNDGIAMSKFEDDECVKEMPTFTHYAKEKDGAWENLCLRTSKYYPIDNATAKTIRKLKKLYRHEPQKPSELPPNLFDTGNSE